MQVPLTAFVRSMNLTYRDGGIPTVRTSEKTPLMSVLLQGPVSSGKTAVAAKVAVESGFPFVRMISADDMIGYSEMSKCQEIHKAFLDSYKSPLSLIFIDDIERIIDYGEEFRFDCLILNVFRLWLDVNAC
jgi:vesicle-fusing ATPase